MVYVTEQELEQQEEELKPVFDLLKKELKKKTPKISLEEISENIALQIQLDSLDDIDLEL